MVIPAKLLDEHFLYPPFDSRLRWFNQPVRWHIDAASSVLVLKPDANTDFWQRTHYGFEADSGHLLSMQVAGDFSMTTKVRFVPAHQYDQAGLMVRAGRDCWIKTSVEYELEEPPKLGAVVTQAGYSDWSVQDFEPARSELLFRISRVGSDFTVEYSEDETRWKILRVTHLPIRVGNDLDCGIYACSPKGNGFRADFDFLRIVRD